MSLKHLSAFPFKITMFLPLTYLFEFFVPLSHFHRDRCFPRRLMGWARQNACRVSGHWIIYQGLITCSKGSDYRITCVTIRLRQGNLDPITEGIRRSLSVEFIALCSHEMNSFFAFVVVDAAFNSVLRIRMVQICWYCEKVISWHFLRSLLRLKNLKPNRLFALLEIQSNNEILFNLNIKHIFKMYIK